MRKVRKFKYRKITLLAEASDEELDRLGEKGWEMCGVTTTGGGGILGTRLHYIYYFKQEILC